MQGEDEAAEWEAIITEAKESGLTPDEVREVLAEIKRKEDPGCAK